MAPAVSPAVKGPWLKSTLFSRTCLPAREWCLALTCAFMLAACQTNVVDGVAAPSVLEDDKLARAPTREMSMQAVTAYVPPTPGTVFTWRNNWKSLPPVISYRVEKPVVISGKTYVKLTSVAGLDETTHAYYDAENYNLKGYRDGEGKAVLSYNPVEERYRFPLQPGDEWVTSWKSKDYRKDKVTKGGGVVRVIGFEELKLPAGRFEAVKIRMPIPPEMAGMRHHIWFSPELGVTVKEQITNGRLNWTQVLESVTKPG